MKTKNLLISLALINIFQSTSALTWKCSTSNVPSSYVSSSCRSTTNIYNFASATLSDFPQTGAWTKTTTGFSSASGLSFVGLKCDQYTITATSSLSNGADGGYGILFDTSLNTSNNQDTGYALQFDRGYSTDTGTGAIIIRPRVAGVEYTPILTITNKNNPIIPASNSSTWWTQVHDVKMDVKNSAAVAGQKTIDVWIDGVKVISGFSFASKSSASNNYTGLRSWAKNTSYNKMDLGCNL